MSILVLTQTGGILKPFAIILGFIMNYIYRFLQIFGINNVALTIILFTLVINVLMIPLTVKQQKFSKMSSLMNPELQKVQKKYQNRKDEKSMRMMQAETQAIYDKYGASPTGGCLPMLIQMPIIMGLFALLRNPMRYIGDVSSMIFAFHESFLWIEDLSQPDPWILPIIAGVATFISFTMNQALTDTGATGAANQMNGMMKMMKYIFPIMILWMARSFPSGLALYWAVSHIIQIFFNIHMASLRKKLKKQSEVKKKK